LLSGDVIASKLPYSDGFYFSTFLPNGAIGYLFFEDSRSLFASYLGGLRSFLPFPFFSAQPPLFFSSCYYFPEEVSVEEVDGV